MDLQVGKRQPPARTPELATIHRNYQAMAEMVARDISPDEIAASLFIPVATVRGYMTDAAFAGAVNRIREKINGNP